MPIESVCLLLGRPSIRDWLVEALKRMESETDASVNLLVRTNTDGQNPETALAHPFDSETVYVRPERVDDSRVAIPDEAVARIAEETDVVIQNGVGILTGDILTEPEYGVLSYHHGNIRRYRGVITHFWNYLNRDEMGGVTLLQLDESLDGGDIAAERTVNLASCLTWTEVEHRKQVAGIPLVADAVANFEDPDFEPTHVPEADLGRMYYSSDVTPPVIAKYLLMETTLTARARFGKLRYLLNIYRD